MGARREEELVGLTVLRSSSPEGNPHRPLSLIIFPCGVVRDPIKLPVLALKALMRPSCKFPTKTALLTGPNCAGASANSHGALSSLADVLSRLPVMSKISTAP
jgi:hypothetical protein